jgi:hypothetical protein
MLNPNVLFVNEVEGYLVLAALAIALGVWLVSYFFWSKKAPDS